MVAARSNQFFPYLNGLQADTVPGQLKFTVQQHLPSRGSRSRIWRLHIDHPQCLNSESDTHVCYTMYIMINV